MQENGLIRMLRLVSKLMTSSTEKQIITIHILPSTSRGKDNQTMKFGHLIEYNVGDNPENETERQVPGLFLFFQKKPYMREKVACILVSVFFEC